MTVKELIDKLQTLDQDKEIGIYDSDYDRTFDIKDIKIDEDIYEDYGGYAIY